MRLENDLFRRLRPNIQRLIEYGFIEQSGIFQYQTKLEDTGMYAVITVDNSAVSGSVLDEFTDEEYIAVHTVGKKGNLRQKLKRHILLVCQISPETVLRRWRILVNKLTSCMNG